MTGVNDGISYGKVPIPGSDNGVLDQKNRILCHDANQHDKPYHRWNAELAMHEEKRDKRAAKR